MAANKQQAAQGKALAANNETNNNKQQQANNKPAQLTEQEIAAILADLIKAAGGALSMSALKKQETDLSEKYGRSNWISIRARHQSNIKSGIDAAADGAAAAVKEYGPALADAWARISGNADFKALAAYLGLPADELAKQWPSGPAFVAATYPAIIDGAPACRRSYVTDGGGFIVDAMQPAELTAARVPAILCGCINNVRRAAVKALKAAQALAAVKPAEYTAGQVVAVYLAARDEGGAIVKGDAAKQQQADTISRAGVAGLVSLAEYRKQQAGQE